MTDEDHGTRMGYGQGCRCPDCRRANTTYEHARRHPEIGAEAMPSEMTIRWSEQKMARQQQLRRIEAETAELLRLPMKSVVEPSSESVFSGLGFFMRRAKPSGSGWGCPSKGCASS